MGPLGGSVGPDADEAFILCDLLGLDPMETTEIRVVLEAGTGAFVEWTGRRRMPLTQIAAAFATATTTTPDAGAPGKWQIGPDPWGKAPEPPC